MIGSAVKAVGGQGVLDWAEQARDWVVDRVGGQVAEKELGETDDPRQLLHGDPEAITTAAGHLGRFAGGFNSVGEGMRGLELDGWRGEAAEKFRQAYTPQPRAWFTAHGAAEQASRALDGFADTVAWARRQAEDALAVYQDGVNRTRRAEAAYQRETDAYNARAEAYNRALAVGADPGPRPSPLGPFLDPGAGQRQRAREILTRAREQRDAQAASALRAVSGATELAPPTPAAGQRMVTVARDMLGMATTEYLHFEGGLAKGLGDMLRFVRQIDPYDPYNITHPAAWIDTVGTTTAALAHADLHPTELAQGLVGTGWSTDPAESLGKLTANIAATAITDGGGEAAATASAASRGAAAARQTAEHAAEHTAEHTAERAAGATAPAPGPTESLVSEHPATRRQSTGPPVGEHPGPRASLQPTTPEPYEPPSGPTPGQPAPPRPDPPPVPDPATAHDGAGLAEPAPAPVPAAAAHDLPNPLTPANLPANLPPNVQAALGRLSAGEQLSDIERALAGLDNIDTTAFTPSPLATASGQAHIPPPAAATHPSVATSAHRPPGEIAAHPPSGNLDAGNLDQALGAAEDELAAVGTRLTGEIRTSADPPPTQPHSATHRSDHTATSQHHTTPENQSLQDNLTANPPTHPPTTDTHNTDSYTKPPPLHRETPLPEKKELHSDYEGEADPANPGGQLFSNVVQYMDRDEIEEYRLFAEDGKLHWASDGTLFDTTHARISPISRRPSAIFVMDEHGNFYASLTRVNGVQAHSSFFAGGPVAGAGEIAAEDRVPFFLNRQSGHYRPDLEHLQQVRDMLTEQGVNVGGIEFDNRGFLLPWAPPRWSALRRWGIY